MVAGVGVLGVLRSGSVVVVAGTRSPRRHGKHHEEVAEVHHHFRNRRVGLECPSLRRVPLEGWGASSGPPVVALLVAVAPLEVLNSRHARGR